MEILQPTSGAAALQQLWQRGHQALLAKDYPAAVHFSKTAAEIAPRDPSALNLYGYALLRGKMPAKAAEQFRKALAIDPKHSDARIGLGMTLVELNQLDEASKCFAEMTQAEPGNFYGWAALSQVRLDLGDIAGAWTASERAFDLSSCEPAVTSARTACLFHQGKIGEALKSFRKDTEIVGVIRQHSISVPLWQGDPLGGRTLAIIGVDQGFGDTIQFARYLPRIADCGSKPVVVIIQPELQNLLSHQGWARMDFRSGGLVPSFDVVQDLQALARLCGDIPSAPYIKADRGRVRKWGKRLADCKAFKVGLSWASKDDPRRSMDLANIAGLADVRGVEFFSLQKSPFGQRHDAGGLSFIDHTAELKDWSDTAALVANLDLVISVDTSVTHLAGAMGKPVWVALPYAADWRWFERERDDSPWYPTARLFRQTTPGDWAGVVERMRGELAHTERDTMPIQANHVTELQCMPPSAV